MAGKCHVCKEPTEMCCSDCAIDLGASVYVCGKRECREHHDTHCPGTREDAPFDWGALAALRKIPAPGLY